MRNRFILLFVIVLVFIYGCKHFIEYNNNFIEKSEVTSNVEITDDKKTESIDKYLLLYTTEIKVEKVRTWDEKIESFTYDFYEVKDGIEVFHLLHQNFFSNF